MSKKVIVGDNNLKREQDFNHDIFGGLTTITNDQGDVFFISSEVSSKLGYARNGGMLQRIDADNKVRLSYDEAREILGSEYGFISNRGIFILSLDGVIDAVSKSKLLCSELRAKFLTFVGVDISIYVASSHEYVFGEEIVNNLFHEYEIISQFSVFGGEFRLDWYVPELKIAIEFDEEQHFRNGELRKECVERQRRVEQALGCRFIRYKKGGRK